MILFSDLDEAGKTANIIVDITRKRIVTLEKDPLLKSDFLYMKTSIISVIIFLIKASNGVIGKSSPLHPQFSDDPIWVNK
jgi:hypothetical protein